MFLRQVSAWMWPVLIGASAMLWSCGAPATPTDSASAQPDTQTTDATVTADSGHGDAIDTDTNAPNDVVAADAADGHLDCPGGAGCACTQNGDCNSAVCIDDPSQPGGKACAQTCTENCPSGYQCAQITATGGDLQSICANATGRLCEPCVKSDDCTSPGLKGAACVNEGALGHFCGIACTQDAQCPVGYVCGTVPTTEGTTSSQCVRQSTAAGEAFGLCTCDAFASASKLATTCFAEVKDAQGKVIGQCPGTRACGASGLGVCNAQSPQPEVCDGVDNNCNGLTDEGSCDDGNPCTQDKCDGKGGCVNLAQDGTPCDADASVCTVGDSCVAGTCKPGKPKNCDDQNPCTQDLCEPTTGCAQTNDDGAPCSDDNPCTIGDTCKSAGCVPGKPKACVGGDACTLAKCNQADGSCAYSNAGNGTPCDDGLLCTQSDSCATGLCVGLPVGCTDDNACTLDACDPKSGCTFKPLAAGACSDGSACTSADACASGGCVGQAVSCDDKNPCTSDSCDPVGGCVHGNASGVCDDGDACTSSDTCSAGVCVGGGNVCPCKVEADCPDDGDVCNGTSVCDTSAVPYGCKIKVGSVVTCNGDACNTATCDAKTGACGLQPVTDGVGCDADGSLCTTGDACAAGSCKSGPAVDCDDTNSCTADACVPAKGCVNTPLTASACDADGDLCTQNDACSAGICVPGKKVLCDDNDLCTNDACVGGACTFTPVGGLGAACYTGPTGTQGIGICHGGITTCDPANGTVCTGQQWPQTEACNAQDDTCNGVTDEGCAATAVSLTFGATRFSAAGPTSLTLRAGLPLAPGSLPADIGYTVYRWGWLDWLLP